MSFLTSADYTKQIKDQHLAQITDENTDLIPQAELVAQEEIETYLKERFDVAAIFAATTNDRNPMIVMYMIDIVLYHLYTRVPPQNMPAIRLDRYDNAKSWLKKVHDGTLTPNLPPKLDDTSEQVPNFILKSETKFGHAY